MRTPPTRLLLAAALATGLVACGGTTETSDLDLPDPGATDSADTAAADDASDGTSMPADDDVRDDGTVTEAEAEAVATAYLGLTEAEAEAQAAVDARRLRVGARDGEQFALTEDYVVGRITVSIEQGIVTAATVEATDGPVSVVS